MDAKQPPRMTVDEKRLARAFHFEQHKAPTEIAALLQRSVSAVCRLLAQPRAPRSIGRPKALSEAKIDTIVALVERMVTDADANHEVSMDMIMRRGRLKVSKKVVSQALRRRYARGIMRAFLAEFCARFAGFR